MGLKPATSRDRGILATRWEMCAWLFRVGRISVGRCSIAATLVTLAVSMHLILMVISSPKPELGFDRSSKKNYFEASQNAALKASGRLVGLSGNASSLFNKDMPEVDKEVKNAVFSRIDALLDTVEPSPFCSTSFHVGGRCMHCWLSEDMVFPEKDGDKTLCFDLLPSNCTVLSFGVNDDFSFEEAMEDLGCTVHAFDPTMGDSGFRYSSGIEFHNMGLGPRDISSQLTPISSLGTIVKRLGMETGVIDYLKLDIESSEWGTLRQQLDSSGDLLRVRQLAVEFHLGHWDPRLSEGQRGMHMETKRWVITFENAKRFLAVLEDLKRAGFRLVYRKRYIMCEVYEGGCLAVLWETLYINTRLS